MPKKVKISPKTMNNRQFEARSVVERSAAIYLSKKYADCKFKVGSKKSKVIPAHKLTLAMSSPVFDAMFFGALPEKQDPIPIPDIKPETFDAMLRYIYTDRVDVQDVGEIMDLWTVADKYLLSNLSARCADKLLPLVTTENVWNIFECALLYSNKTLIGRCSITIAFDCDPPLALEGLDTISLEKLKLILDADKIKVESEVAVFKALEQWAKMMCQKQGIPETTESLRKVSAGCVEKIRFLTMTPKEFVKCPGLSPLLTKDERYSIMFNIPDPENAGSEIEIPRGFSTSLISRSVHAQQSLALPYKWDGNPGKRVFIPVYDGLQGKATFIQKGQAFSFSFKVDGDFGLKGIQLQSSATDFKAYLISEELKLIASWSMNEPSQGPLKIEKDKAYTLRVVVNREGSYNVGLMGTADDVKHLNFRSYNSHEPAKQAKVTLSRDPYDPRAIVLALDFVTP